MSSEILSTGRKENPNKARVLVIGTFRPKEIEVIMSDKEMPISPQLHERIEDEWAPKAAMGWFPGPLSRVESLDLSDKGNLRLTLGKTTFKEYTGSRSLETLRRYGYDKISNPLSCSVVLTTSDNKMLIAKHIYGDARDSIDAIGGYTHPEKDLRTISRETKIDIFAAARRELKEETGILFKEIDEIWCLGISYEYKGLCHPVASFVATTELTSAEALSRKVEEIEVIAVNPKKVAYSDNENYVMRVLDDHYPKVEPDGRVTIALARKWLQGVTYPKRVLKTTDAL